MDNAMVLGIFYHLLGALAAASFYIPLKLVKNWEWEASWLVNGIASWLIMPVLVSSLLLPDVTGFFLAIPLAVAGKTFLFGALWGLGGLTFGMTLRYLGLSVGYGVAIGITLVVGTLMPPLLNGALVTLLASAKGAMALAGVAIAVLGIALTTLAGRKKERESGVQNSELNVRKGVAIAIFCGITSAFMAFAIDAAGPIQAMALRAGVDPLYQVMPGYVIIMAGGFVTNGLYCVYKARANHTLAKIARDRAHRWRNVALSATGGVIWYMQFFFYGWGHVQLAAADLAFVSWTFHMSMLVLCGGVWGFVLKEWRGCSRLPLRYQAAGMALIVISTLVIGLGGS
nr:L-rhamnose/proton symporter RhaT [uncultured Enterobacter sp.]